MGTSYDDDDVHQLNVIHGDVVFQFEHFTGVTSNRVSTIAKPEDSTRNEVWRKMVVCHPGITEVAKSIDTIVWTDNTRGCWKDRQNQCYGFIAAPGSGNHPIQSLSIVNGSTGFMAGCYRAVADNGKIRDQSQIPEYQWNGEVCWDKHPQQWIEVYPQRLNALGSGKRPIKSQTTSTHVEAGNWPHI